MFGQEIMSRNEDGWITVKYKGSLVLHLCLTPNMFYSSFLVAANLENGLI